MFTCPGCGLLVEIVTTNHLRDYHNSMSKKEFKAIYGELKYVTPPTNREFLEWMGNHKAITNADFDVPQSLAYMKR